MAFGCLILSSSIRACIESFLFLEAKIYILFYIMFFIFQEFVKSGSNVYVYPLVNILGPKFTIKIRW